MQIGWGKCLLERFSQLDSWLCKNRNYGKWKSFSLCFVFFVFFATMNILRGNPPKNSCKINAIPSASNKVYLWCQSLENTATDVMSKCFFPVLPLVHLLSLFCHDKVCKAHNKAAATQLFNISVKAVNWFLFTPVHLKEVLPPWREVPLRGDDRYKTIPWNHNMLSSFI